RNGTCRCWGRRSPSARSGTCGRAPATRAGRPPCGRSGCWSASGPWGWDASRSSPLLPTLPFQAEEDDPVTHSRRLVRARLLEGDGAAIGAHHGVGGLVAGTVVEG